MEASSPSKAYLFDIDGVLTNPEIKRVEHEELFTEIIKRLQFGFPVGLNSGRSEEYITHRVLRPLEKQVREKKLLQLFFAFGEEGTVCITYPNGQRNLTIDHLISVPEEVTEEMKQLVGKPPFSNIVFYDSTKQTMATLELKTGVHVSQFHEIEHDLSNKLQEILTRYNLTESFRVDPTDIAINIESVKVGKALGARRFAETLQEQEITPLEYLCFGDSPSDYEMFEELKRLGKKTTFIFVDDIQLLLEKDLEGVVATKEHFDKGTLEFLQHENV